ncbi:hypothetical protein P4O66_016527 [Electrophorus voltai]|uniref:Protein kinase domain-containing protein n=1 Tax=Electrophorus voltai TaxID=2609070 RepID=A0AAD8YY41_9TELE|nr:hypothetical protein P4O66_016527 [Electrophorus voltai]
MQLQHTEERRYSSRWRGFLSRIGVSLSPRLCRLYPQRVDSRRMIRDKGVPVPEQMPGHEKLRNAEWNLPGFISMFLPEFPHRNAHLHEHFEVLSYIAKGSFGPILKVKDKMTQKMYAVKVIPKSEIIRLGVLNQSKEEVIVQHQVHHPFIHDLQDCWQTQHHLNISEGVAGVVCDYCSTGDLYTYWVMIGQFMENTVKVFAAELGCAIGHVRLADFGLSRRLEQGGRAFTICGTIQYMAPEVLSGGPYNHAADWWSLGILLFALATGKFPLSAESDHSNMLRKMCCFPYDMPRAFSPPFALLLTELLCKNPMRRLRSLERFKGQTFFRGMPFDAHLLQKSPVEPILELRERPDRAAKARRGITPEPFPQFDSNLLTDSTLTPAAEMSPAWAKLEILEDFTHSNLPEGNVFVYQDAN